MSASTEHGPCTFSHPLSPQLYGVDHCHCPAGVYCTAYPPLTTERGQSA